MEHIYGPRTECVVTKNNAGIVTVKKSMKKTCTRNLALRNEQMVLVQDPIVDSIIPLKLCLCPKIKRSSNLVVIFNQMELVNLEQGASTVMTQ